jgi:hypothetical protein
MTAALVLREALTLHIEGIKVKDKVIPMLNYLTTVCRSGCIDPHLLDLGTSWR